MPSAKTRSTNRKLVILKLDAGHVGLLVYSIDSILAFFESDILPFRQRCLASA